MTMHSLEGATCRSGSVGPNRAIHGAPMAAADLAAAARAAALRAEQDTAAAIAAETEAKRLDTIVQRLARDAKTELVAESNGIPGMGITAKGITLENPEGHPVLLSKCSTSQRAVFAAQLACTAHPKAGWIVCDNLEALGPKKQAALIAAVAATGRQLVAAIVRECQLTISPLPRADIADLFA